MDLYDPCPCGSGKKFKWCCQPIYADIEKAFRQDDDGQHEAAIQTLDSLAKEHGGNPEVWGRKAELLFRNDKVEEAEAAVEKAFQINPDYPYGHFLRGLFRQHEGEVQGALIEFRKAADTFDPEARGTLGMVYARIAEAELAQNRPLAARAALDLSLRYAPNEELRKAIDSVFGEQSRFPATARPKYNFQPAPANLPADRKAAWDKALTQGESGRLADIRKGFETITQSDPENPAGWYNLGLVRAWQGDNRPALDAIDRYVNLEKDETKAAAGWALGQVLRLGRGMEPESDYIEHSFRYQLRDPQVISQALQEWDKSRRMLVLEAREDAPVFSALVLEQVVSLAGSSTAQLPRLGAYFIIIGDQVRIWHTNEETLNKIRDELVAKAGPGLADARPEKRNANFADVMTAALVFPVGVNDEAEASKKVAEGFQNYFEEQWLHKPLKALNNTPPVDAAGHPVLKKKLLGVIQYLQETAAITKQPYDFDRLRRKLGLTAGAAAPAKGDGAPDIASLGAAELAALKSADLAVPQLEQAFQTSLKLDARELAGKFAKEIVARPADPGRPDRFPWFTHLVQLAQQEGNLDQALDYVNAGEKADCEQNEGKRRNEYELRRGQLHVKRGEFDQAVDVFGRLVERVPAELKFRGSAVETLLSARQGAPALKLAEPGLAKARELQNRDMEHYFMELVEAAKKQAK